MSGNVALEFSKQEAKSAHESSMRASFGVQQNEAQAKSRIKGIVDIAIRETCDQVASDMTNTVIKEMEKFPAGKELKDQISFYLQKIFVNSVLEITTDICFSLIKSISVQDPSGYNKTLESNIQKALDQQVKGKLERELEKAIKAIIQGTVFKDMVV